MTPTPDPAAVRAACERVRDALDCTSIDLDNMSVACVADLVTIGRAYLAAHPPADARPAAGERYVTEHANGACMVAVKSADRDAPFDIIGVVISRSDADLLAHGRRRVAELEAALKPFAAVRLPDSWPAGCVVDWRENVGRDGHRFASASYLDIDAQGGPTVADYRAARQALAGGRP